MLASLALGANKVSEINIFARKENLNLSILDIYLEQYCQFYFPDRCTKLLGENRAESQYKDTRIRFTSLVNQTRQV